MAYSVHKFKINTSGDTKVIVPLGALIYKWGIQDDTIVFWARVNVEERASDVFWFRLYTTGQHIEAMEYAQDYCETLILEKGFVVHIFKICKDGTVYSE